MKPTFGAGRADPVRPPSDGDYYRFLVKAPRDLNGAIEKLAKARGVSSGVLVQQHFERILEHPLPPIVVAPPRPEEREASAGDDREMAVSLGVTPLAVRVHRVMARLADRQGNLCAPKADIAKAVGHNGENGGSIANALTQLETRRLIKLVEKGRRNKGSTWHVYSIEGRAP